jgi:hypothetical protein
MLQLRENLSGVVQGVGAGRLRVVIDAETRDEAESKTCRDLAVKTASENGFANAGFCDTPMVNPLNAETNEVLKDEEAFNPTTKLGGYRAEFLFAQRL